MSACRGQMLRDGILLLVVVAMLLLPGCITTEGFGNFSGSDDQRITRDVASYYAAGKQWGEILLKEGKKPDGTVNQKFVSDLVLRIDYFSINSELKEAFKKGFRTGFADRTADLVLGPHLTSAAGLIGTDTATKFVNVVQTFETGWADTLRHAVDVFIILISEGSQADRETFINNFTNVYTAKWNNTQQIMRSHQKMTLVSGGGTMLYIDYSKGHALGALDIPSPDALKTEIYNQTFRVMGDEWGRRYANNLIKRDELVDLLRRCKTALFEVPAPAKESNISRNLATIQAAYVTSYGTDAENVFRGLIKEAGYTTVPLPPVPPPKLRTPPVEQAADSTPFDPNKINFNDGRVNPDQKGRKTGMTRSNIIMEAQRLLNEKGYDVGTPDGRMGQKTQRAISSFQHDKKMNVTGEVDQPTMDKLREP